MNLLLLVLWPAVWVVRLELGYKVYGVHSGFIKGAQKVYKGFMV